MQKIHITLRIVNTNYYKLKFRQFFLTIVLYIYRGQYKFMGQNFYFDYSKMFGNGGFNFVTSPFSMNTQFTDYAGMVGNSAFWDFSLFNFNNLFFSNFNPSWNFSTNFAPNISAFNASQPTQSSETLTKSENIFSLSNNVSSPTDTFVKTNYSRKTGSLQLAFAEHAKSYDGRVNSDKEGNRLFSNGKKQAWCADFVTCVAKETFGNKLPSDFGSSSVSELRSWANENDCYLKMPSSDKANFIAQNIKVGDIMIEKDGGKSHTGIVTQVNPDGSFETVEGNCSNKVSKCNYSANSKTLSGFITLDKYASMA